MPSYHRRRAPFDPASKEPYKISRSKIDLFVQCPRCFYLDCRKSIPRPSTPPFRLNSAVDTLLKKEFDVHRTQQTKHPLMESYGIDAVPYYHEKLNDWRENFVGIQHLHEPSNFLVTGAIDDVWKHAATGELIVVDYKATSKDQTPTIEGKWQRAYKRQLEIYQWLLRQSGFPVSNTGYFVYCNGKTDRQAFDRRLEFDVIVIPYDGKDDWIADTLASIRTTLASDELPAPGPECEYCPYRASAAKLEVH